jgi:hypothetical protein
MPNRKHSSEGGRMSLDSSVTSCDGTNETGMRSRHNSSSTVGTIYSEAASTRMPASTTDDFKFHSRIPRDQSATDSQSEYDSAEDLQSHDEHAFEGHGRRGSNAVALCRMPFSSGSEHMDSNTLPVFEDPPTSTGKASPLPDITTSVLQQPACSDLKKRIAENVGDPISPSKKPKTESQVDRCPADADETYERAMAIIMRRRSFRLD